MFRCPCGTEPFWTLWKPGDNVRCPRCDQDWTTDYTDRASGPKPFLCRKVADQPDHDEDA